MNPPLETEAVTTGLKAASALNHLKENRIEYLLLLVAMHLLDFTSVVLDKAQGVCY